MICLHQVLIVFLIQNICFIQFYNGVNNYRLDRISSKLKRKAVIAWVAGICQSVLLRFVPGDNSNVGSIWGGDRGSRCGRSQVGPTPTPLGC